MTQVPNNNSRLWAAQWDVNSHSEPHKVYKVSKKHDGSYICSCPAHIFQKVPKHDCKHILEVIKEQQGLPVTMNLRRIVLVDFGDVPAPAPRRSRKKKEPSRVVDMRDSDGQGHITDETTFYNKKTGESIETTSQVIISHPEKRGPRRKVQI